VLNLILTAFIVPLSPNSQLSRALYKRLGWFNERWLWCAVQEQGKQNLIVYSYSIGTTTGWSNSYANIQSTNVSLTWFIAKLESKISLWIRCTVVLSFPIHMCVYIGNMYEPKDV